MANIRPKDLPTVTSPTAGDTLILDGATSRAITFENLRTANATALAGQFPGTGTNDSASSGKVGEFLNNAVNNASMTSTVALNGGSLNLSAGDWEVQFFAYFVSATSTAITEVRASISDTSVTHNSALGTYNRAFLNGAVPGNNFAQALITPTFRISLASTTTYYGVATSTFSVSTLNLYGILRARRAR